MAPIGMEPATSPGSLRGFCLSAERELAARCSSARWASWGTRRRRPRSKRVRPSGWPAVRWPSRMVEVIVRHPDGRIARASGPLAEVADWAPAAGWLDALSRPRQPFAGLALDRPAIMGVVNVTPDSFSDGGDFLDHANAIAQGTALLDAGADILDVGGELTRPGADPVSPEEEIRRVVPVVRHFAEHGRRRVDRHPPCRRHGGGAGGGCGHHQRRHRPDRRSGKPRRGGSLLGPGCPDAYAGGAAHDAAGSRICGRGDRRVRVSRRAGRGLP